jgi:hypothetical protein
MNIASVKEKIMSNEDESQNINRMANGINILKSRDDHQPVFFEKDGDNKFKLCSGTDCSWLKTDESFGPDKLRPRIEPWLTALVQSEYFSLLIGSGFTHAVHWIAQHKDLPGMKKADFNVFQSQIDKAAKITAEAAGRDKANFEDQIRVANELLSGLEHYCPESNTSTESEELRKKIAKLKQDINQALNDFSKSILEGENSIASADELEREKAFGYLVNFLMSFASRSGTRDR